ncbi:MAG: AAA family ATPase [Hamadaea sp.]|nr:AAA family ATPase [Hamadaea sp.]
MYAQRIRPLSPVPGARWLELSRPDGTYPGWVVIVGPNGAGKSALLEGVAAADPAAVELTGPAGPLAFYRDDRRVPPGDRVTALADDLLRRLSGPVPADVRGTVLIDEVEAHLHLTGQQEIGFRLTTLFPGVQFLVATHSPYACQAADVAVRLDPVRPAYVADDDLLHRAVFGSGDDAALSDLFGLPSPYSPAAVRLREELVGLEMAVLDGAATAAQVERFRDLQALLTSSPEARTEEVRARLRRRAAAARERRA